MTPDAAIERLIKGNERYVNEQPEPRDHRARARETADAQTPFAAVLACKDSRVSPEIIFDQGIGDIFASRVAGNYASDDVIGGLEFATKVVGAKAIVVVGHSGCGAVIGACDGVKLGLLTKTLDNIAPAVEQTPCAGERNSSNASFLSDVIATNARLAAERILERSDVIRELVIQGDVKVAAATHDLATGAVTFL